MILKHQPIDIEDNDIFKFDKLDRKESIENLSSLLISTNNAFTLSINANWGAGKTTFIKLWKAYLKHAKIDKSKMDEKAMEELKQYV